MSNRSRQNAYTFEQTARIAQSFKTGTSPAGYTLSEVRIEADAGIAGLHLYSDSGGKPPNTALFTISPLTSFVGGGRSPSRTYRTYTTRTGGYTLDPDTTYWLVWQPDTSDGFNVKWTSDTSETGLAGWSIEGAQVPNSTGNAWQAAALTGALRVELRGGVRRPPAPTDVSLRPSSSPAVAFVVAWTRVSEVFAYDYELRYKAVPSGSCGTTGYGNWRAATGSEHSDLSGPDPARRYCVQVRARSGALLGFPSTAVSGGTLAEAPANFTATADSAASITLRWAAVTRAVRYEYTRATGTANCFRLSYGPWTSAGTGTSHTVVGLTPGTRYCFVLRARSLVGSGVGSEDADATTQTLVAPGSLTAEDAGSRTVVLRWDRVAGATGYQYQRKALPSGSCGTAGYGGWQSTGADVPAHRISGLVDGRRYCFRVRATAGAQNGPASVAVNATPTDLRRLVYPAAVQVPEGLTASFGVKLSSRPAGTVTLTPEPGTPRDTDISLPTGTLTFDASNWNTAQTVALTAAEDDDRQDGASLLAYRAAEPPPYNGVTGHSISIFEIDDEFEATLTAVPDRVAEGEAVTFTVTRDVTRPQPVPVVLQIFPGTAGRDDYAGNCSPRLLFRSGSRSASCTLATREDARDEPDETFTAKLQHPDLFSPDPPSVTVTIEDDDAAETEPDPEPEDPIEVSLSVEPNPTDEGQDVEVTVSLSRAPALDQRIPLTLTAGTAETGVGADYDPDIAPASPLLIRAGNRAARATIMVHTDGDDDEDTFTVAVDAGNLPDGLRAGSRSSVLVTIEDDDAMGGSGSRETLAYWDSNRDGMLTCGEAARGLKLPAYPYTDDGALHETAVIQNWLEDPFNPDFGPKCETYSRPSGYVPCRSYYNPDPAEQDAFQQCLARSRGGADHDLPPVPTPVPALPAAAAAALAALLAAAGTRRRRRLSGTRQ